MPEIIYTESFAKDFAIIELEGKRNEVIECIERLAVLPIIGSRNLPKSIEEKYGSNVRKLVVKPFDAIYEYNEKDNEIRVYGLVPAKMAF